MTLELPGIGKLDEGAMAAARAHQGQLTKPAGSLGRLEELAIWYAGVRGRFPAAVPGRAELFVFAADHGVTAEGVSAYPSEVTAAMVANFRAGGAAVSVLARHSGVDVTVVDVGVRGGGGVSGDAAPAPAAERATAPPPRAPIADDLEGVAAGAARAGAGIGPVSFISAPVRAGTHNMRRGPAMSRADAAIAVGVGLRMARQAATRRADVLLGGEMGIGNSTAAAALLCAFGGDDPGAVVGRGTGIDDQALTRKASVIREALARAGMETEDALGKLAAVGGFEIAALAGLMIGGAAARIPVLVDGFIAGAAALVATRLSPAARPFLLLSHMSAERGARRLCALLDGPGPVLDLGLRLGEGTGAVLAVPLLRAAVATQVEMATFASAGVPLPD